MDGQGSEPREPKELSEPRAMKAMNMRRARVLVVAFGALAFLLAACTGPSIRIKTDEGEGSATVERDSGDVKIETDEGNFEIGSGAEIPKDFPSDVPLPKRYEVRSSGGMSGEEGGLQTVLLEVPDSRSDMASFYDKELAANGWKVASKFSMQDGTVLAAEKSNRALSVALSSDGGKTVVSLTLTQR